METVDQEAGPMPFTPKAMLPDKIKSNTPTSGNENDIEVNEFLKKTPVFPCFLISKDEGRLETIFDGFEKKNIPIQKYKENSFIITYQENAEDFNFIVDKKISQDISLFGNSLNFEANVNKDVKRNREEKVFVGEYKLYSFSIQEEDLSFSKYYLDKFHHIANSNSSDEKKAQELENIFTSTGYYIPKKIYIGGMLTNSSDKLAKSKTMNAISSLEFKFDTKMELEKTNFSNNDKSNFNAIFNSQNSSKIGGEPSSKTFEDWIKSINLKNSSVIECSNIIPAKNILEANLRMKLEVPLQIIEDKYLRKKKYIEYVNQFSNKKEKEKLCDMKGYKNFSAGICKESNITSEPRVYMKKFIIDTHVSYFPPVYYEEFYQQFSDIIVGFSIIDDRKDGHNGQWYIKNEPIGSKELKLSFGSGVCRGQDFTINVYLMEYPK